MIDCAQVCKVLLSAKWQMLFFSLKPNKSFKEILNKNGPKVDPCGTPKRTSNH